MVHTNVNIMPLEILKKYTFSMYYLASKKNSKVNTFHCYCNWKCLRCNAILIISKALSIVYNSPLLAPWF